MAQWRTPSGAAGRGEGAKHAPQHAGHDLALRAVGAATHHGLEQHGEAGLAQAKDAAGQQVGRADRRERNPD